MASSVVIFSLFFLSLFSFSSCIPSETILDAAETLFDNGFVSMSLTLEVLPDSFFSQSSSLTIFSPSDASFSRSGQPSLALLQFHFSPHYSSHKSLKSLALGTKIPTMLNSRSLTVTPSQSDSDVSLNRVKINSSSLFDNGSLIIFGIDEFFDLEFQLLSPTQSPVAEFGCGTLVKNNPFGEAVKTLRSNGYFWMALFLESQIPVFKNGESMITVFALSDESMMTHISNFSEYPSLYFRQISPCRFLWNDLVNLEEGTELPTYMEGQVISVSISIGTLMINGMTVFYPDMYYDEWLVVHGLRDVFGKVEDEVSEMGSTNQEMVREHVRFGKAMEL